MRSSSSVFQSHTCGTERAAHLAADLARHTQRSPPVSPAAYRAPVSVLMCVHTVCIMYQCTFLWTCKCACCKGTIARVLAHLDSDLSPTKNHQTHPVAVLSAQLAALLPAGSSSPPSSSVVKRPVLKGQKTRVTHLQYAPKQTECILCHEMEIKAQMSDCNTINTAYST